MGLFHMQHLNQQEVYVIVKSIAAESDHVECILIGFHEKAQRRHARCKRGSSNSMR